MILCVNKFYHFESNMDIFFYNFLKLPYMGYIPLPVHRKILNVAVLVRELLFWLKTVIQFLHTNRIFQRKDIMSGAAHSNVDKDKQV